MMSHPFPMTVPTLDVETVYLSYKYAVDLVFLFLRILLANYLASLLLTMRLIQCITENCMKTHLSPICKSIRFYIITCIYIGSISIQLFHSLNLVSATESIHLSFHFEIGTIHKVYGIVLRGNPTTIAKKSNFDL